MGYGDIMKIPTIGASQQTASQDDLWVLWRISFNIPYSGLRASHTMAETDLQRMKNYKKIIKDVGREKEIDPALIAGIISRESRAGNTIDYGDPDTDGYGDNGNAFGLMQVDKNWHRLAGKWNSKAHLLQATQILVDFIDWMRNNRGGRSAEQRLKAAIAAYNIGETRVPDDDATVDVNTTGGDYSNDVVARAQYYKGKGF